MKWHQASGVTILEAMLSLAIAASIILFGMQMYQQYKIQADAFSLKYNVDQLLVAMAHFYQANCPPGGAFWYSKTAPITSTYWVVLQSSAGQANLLPYLSSSWQPSNPLVSSYSMQFNPSQMTRSQYACYNATNNPINVGCTTPTAVQSGQQTVLLWQMQVAVQLANPDYTKAISGMIGADCVSDNPGGCNNSAANPSYLIWQRSPSTATTDIKSPLWLTTPRVNEFNLQYTHDVMYEISNASYANTQYYYCGG